MFIVEWIKNLFQKQPLFTVQDYDKYKGKRMANAIRTQLYIERYKQLKKLYPKMTTMNICEMIGKENGIKGGTVYRYLYRNNIKVREII